MKICTKCREEKTSNEFYAVNTPKQTKDGLNSWCKECSRKSASAWRNKNRDRAVEANRAWAKKNWATHYEKNKQKYKDTARSNRLRISFSMSVDDYEAMYKAQKGACGLCEKQHMGGRRLAVDHDHKTGKIRALLCGNCNRGIGYLGDDAALLRKAADYLDSHKFTEAP